MHHKHLGTIGFSLIMKAGLLNCIPGSSDVVEGRVNSCVFFFTSGWHYQRNHRRLEKKLGLSEHRKNASIGFNVPTIRIPFYAKKEPVEIALSYSNDVNTIASNIQPLSRFLNQGSSQNPNFPLRSIAESRSNSTLIQEDTMPDIDDQTDELTYKVMLISLILQGKDMTHVLELCSESQTYFLKELEGLSNDSLEDKRRKLTEKTYSIL